MTHSITMDEFTLCDAIYKSGAVFLLSKEIQNSFDKFYSKKIGIWEISIKDKSKLLVVKTKRKIKPSNIFELAYKIAQDFLDFLSVEIRQFNSVKNHQNFVLWYYENDKKILEVTSRSAMNIISRTQVEIKPVDKRKKSRILKNDLKTHHPSLRYFRLSRNNKDFIDAFRNQYLAFEQLLSSIRPKRGGEWNWISTTLNLSTKLSAIAKILKCNDTDVNTKFKSRIYNVRNALFHAKKGEIYYLPGDIITKKKIIDSLQTLEYINWVLLDEHYNTTIARGGIVIGGLQQIAKNFCIKEKQFQLLISNKINSINKDGKLSEETSFPHLIANANSEIQYCSSKIFTDFEVNSVLSKFSNLSRMCLLGSSGLYSISQLEKPINITNIIDIIRINEYIDITSDDFHQFYY